MSTEAPGLEGADAEHHLDPADDGKGFAEDAVDSDEGGTDPFFRSPLEMEFEVDAKEGLCGEIEDEEGSEGSVCGVWELLSFVAVAEEVATYGEKERGSGYWDVEAMSNHA